MSASRGVAPPALCAILLAGALTASCDSPPPPAQETFTTRDSAGIQIVESRDLQNLDSLSWLVDTTNVLTIGSQTGDERYLFGRITGLARTPDGRIIAADTETNELRYFDSTGKYIGTAGGAGSGPGEYINLRALQRFGDSLLVQDYEGMRAHWTSLDGNHARTFRPRIRGLPENTGSAPDIVGRFSDGTLLVMDYEAGCVDPSTHNKLCTDSSRFARVSESGELLTDYGLLPTGRSAEMKTKSGRTVYASFYASMFTAAHGRHFYHADADHSDIRVYHTDGRLVRIIRLALERKPFVLGGSGGMLLAESRPPSADANRQMQERQEALMRAPRPEHRPAHQGFFVDREGNIWLRELLDMSARLTYSTWVVIDTAGVARHRVKVPNTADSSRAALFMLPSNSQSRVDIGADYILGPAVDVDGVYYARLLRLLKQH